MRALADLEQFFERLFERPSARLFRTHLQPIHLQRRIERAMEGGRVTGVDRSYAPHVFSVHLAPEDLAAFAGVEDVLATELADAALAFARAHHFALADRPRVELVEDRAVHVGDVRVRSGFGEERSGAGAAVATTGRLDDVHTDPAAESEGGAPTSPASGQSDTRVFEVPEVRAPRAALRVTEPDGRERRLVVEGAVTTIGRADDNAIVLADRRVSRHHVRLHVRRGGLVLTDLGSTNGSRVNGMRVEEVALGGGDRIELGDTTLVVESAD